jgi:hypothetical protein
MSRLSSYLEWGLIKPILDVYVRSVIEQCLYNLELSRFRRQFGSCVYGSLILEGLYDIEMSIVQC